MQISDAVLIIGAFVGAVTGIGGLLVSLRSAKKDEVDALRGIIEELREELEKACREREALVEDNRELWRGILSMSGQLTNHDIEPEWTPTTRVLQRYGTFTLELEQ